MAKKDLLKEAKKLGLELTMKNTVIEIKGAIEKKTHIRKVTREKMVEEYGAAPEAVKPPKFRSLQAGISHSVIAGVSRVVFQDLENTGNRFVFEDGVEWKEVSERLRTFLMEG